MLKLLAVSSFLLAAAFGAGTTGTGGETGTGESTSGETTKTTTKTAAKTNYFLYTTPSSGQNFALAIDQCSLMDFASTKYIKPTCVDTTHISLGVYTTSDCSSLESTSSYNSSSATFRCDGVSGYLEVMFGIGAATCSNTFYVAPGACIPYASGSSYYADFGCTVSSKGILGLYTTSGCSGTAIAGYNFNGTCEYIFTSQATGLDIYGSVSTCSLTGAAATTTASSMGTTAASTTIGTTTGDANVVTFKNIVGIFIMVVCIMISLL